MTLQTLVRAISGHNFLAKHQNRIGEPIAPECRLCQEEPETFHHLLTKCPRLRQVRDEIYLGRDPLGDMDWKVRDIVRFINTTVAWNMLT